MLALGKGHPHSSYLPLKQLLEHAPSSAIDISIAEEALQYGEEQGSLRFRNALFSLMKQKRPDLQKETFIKRVIQTSGSSQGLDLICGRLAQPGDVILVETPTYFLVKDVFEQHGLRVVQVPVVDEKSGSSSSAMDIDKLREMLELRQINPRLLYTVPVCNNPMGYSMSTKDASKLIALASQYGFKIVADEVYLLLQFVQDNQDIQVSLFDLPGALDVVISLNSFSKILGPGIRLGWIEANESTIEVLIQTGFIQSGGGVNPFAASIVSGFIESGKQAEHIRYLCSEYQRRYTILVNALEQHLGAIPVEVAVALRERCPRTCYVRVKGGFFVWVRFASSLNIDTGKLLKEASSTQNVSFLTGDRFLVGDSSESAVSAFSKASIRLCFAYLEEGDLGAAVMRLAKAVEGYVPQTTEKSRGRTLIQH